MSGKVLAIDLCDYEFRKEQLDKLVKSLVHFLHALIAPDGVTEKIEVEICQILSLVYALNLKGDYGGTGVPPVLARGLSLAATFFRFQMREFVQNACRTALVQERLFITQDGKNRERSSEKAIIRP